MSKKNNGDFDFSLNKGFGPEGEALDMNKGEQSFPDRDDMSATDIIKNKDTINLVPSPELKKEGSKNDNQRECNDNNSHEEVKVTYGLSLKEQVPRDETKIRGGGYINFKQSEHLRIAQKKMNDMEEKLTKLSRENEDIASAAETYKKLNDEYFNTIENLKSKLTNQKQMYSQEIELLKKINRAREKEIHEYKQQIEDYELRVKNDFQRVRKREKELEHRLEIAKMDEAAVIKNKDQMILDLKKRVDEISNESDNFRRKSQENYKEFHKKQQTVRSVIRVLRIAITKLEGDDDSDFGLEPNQPISEDDHE